MVNGWHPVSEASTPIEEGKTKSVISVGWIACYFPSNDGRTEKWFKKKKGPCVWLFTDSWAVASGLALWSSRRVVETWPITWLSVWGTALRKSEGYIKVGKSRPIRSTPSGWEGDWNSQAYIPMCSLKAAAWVHEISGHRGLAAMCRQTNWI